MKQIHSVTFLLLLTLLLPLPHPFAQSIEGILERAEQNIRKTTLLSYHADYTNINPTVNDSVSNVSGTIWLRKVPADSVFGAYFHLKGEDGSGKVEYFYDGQNSYEIRHEEKKILIFHPHEHPNTPNNSAKDRTALLPFQKLLINHELKSTILANRSHASLNEKQDRWIIRVNYQVNESGQGVTKSLEIEKSTYRIIRTVQTVKWRGATYRSRGVLSSYQQDASLIADEIFMSKNYGEYSKEEFQRERSGENNLYEHVIGKQAPGFSFTSFSGNEISLDDLKGMAVLLDFWEFWCGYCIMAMPKLNELQRQWKDNLTIIGIVTENKQPVEKLIKNNGLIYPNVYADRTILEEYRVSNRPTYVLIDQDGRISTVILGDLDTIESKIRQLMK